MANIVLLTAYYHKHDAQLLIGLLKDAGIEAILQSDDAGGFHPHLTLGVGNNRVLVQKKDVEKAMEILNGFQEKVSQKDMKQIDEIAVQSEETPVPPKKRTKKKDYSVTIPVVFATVFLFSFVFQKTHKAPIDSYKYRAHVECRTVRSGEEIYDECIEYYRNNTIRWIGKFKGNTPVEDSKAFFQDGQLRWEGIFANGKLNGAFKEYFESGTLRSEGSNKNNLMEGEFREYYESGKIKYISHFKQNELHGNHKTYYESGKLMEDLEFDNGFRFDKQGKKFHGIEKTYFEDGALWEEIIYKNGKMDGLYRSYYKTGKIEYESNYRNGKLHGYDKYFFENGQLSYLSIYKNNVLTYVKEYDREGNVIFESHY